MAVYISNRYIYVQVIDDEAQKTLCSVSSLGGKCTVEAAKELGTKAAEAATAAGISQVVFDRGGFTFGSRLRALADSAREAGLKF
jgi:large subunit ribosomal protein L18